jgi:riboflavin biosynthesis pyrimidine reductase
VDRIFPEQVRDVTDDQLIEWYSDSPSGASVSFNFVSSVDGSATVDGRAGGLGDDADQKILRLLRRLADVLVVGAGTIRAEGYSGELTGPDDAAWREANGRTRRPAVAVVSGDLRMDPASDFFANAPERPILFTSSRSDAGTRAKLGRVAEVIVAGDESVDPRLVLSDLADRGYSRIHSEGGPHLFGAFHDVDAIDELCLTVSPHLAGGDGTRILAGSVERLMPLDLLPVLHNDGALFLRYRIRR